MTKAALWVTAGWAILAAIGCGGASSDEPSGCDGSCAQQALSTDDVETVIAQAAAQAEFLGQPVTIAVTDRVGNVLGVFAMEDAPGVTRLSGRRGVTGGLEGLDAAAAAAAISKAGTAAYLSSQGNAFTTRTASQIVQQHFNPGERDRPGGPLFGVQLTQLPCGDLVTRFDVDGRTGPRRMPLGLAGDPGGVPLFKHSSSADGRVGRVPVGAIGVEGVLEPDVDADPNEAQERALYGLDLAISDVDLNLEERIAVAGSRGFEAPQNRRADRISVDGKFLRFVDDEADLALEVPELDQLPGELIPVPGFAAMAISAGEVLGTASSGYLETTFAGIPAEVLVDREGAERFPPRDSPAADGLRAGEVASVLANALGVAALTRAQIRRPLGSTARVTVVVVDVGGEILGIVRSRDAPVFGTDTALQKARTAAFFSSPDAAADLQGAGFGSYVTRVRVFLGDPQALTGQVAFSDRAGGNLSRPFFPDGIAANPPGPLSNPIGAWSPFSTGLQTDLVKDALLPSLVEPQIRSCTGIPSLPNGIQIFPGSVPIYRGDTLVGGIGISGDGVDQDDLVAFLGLHNAAIELCAVDPDACAAGATIGNAPPEIRADRIAVDGSFLRFVNCPVKPFVNLDSQGVCDGL